MDDGMLTGTYDNTHDIPIHVDNGLTLNIMPTHILIEERISTLSTLVRKSVCDFQSQMKKYAADELQKPQQIMDLLENQSYAINMGRYLTITARSSPG